MGACVLFVCASNQLPIGDFQLFVLEVYSVHFPVPVPGGCNRIDGSECEVHRSAYRGNQIDPRNGVFYTETHTHWWWRENNSNINYNICIAFMGGFGSIIVQLGWAEFVGSCIDVVGWRKGLKLNSHIDSRTDRFWLDRHVNVDLMKLKIILCYWQTGSFYINWAQKLEPSRW